VLALTFSATSASAASFNFETTPLGTYNTLVMTDSGLTMTLTRTSGNDFTVSTTVVGQPPAFGTRNLQNFSFCCPTGDQYNANFSTGINYFQIDFGDFFADNDTPVQLRAFSGYNGSGAQLDVHSLNWTAGDGFPDFATLIVQSATPILSVQFAGNNPAAPNSLFWDNITTRGEDALVALPEPVSLTMIGAGLFGVAAIRRRIR
jgi:hypothetical protein